MTRRKTESPSKHARSPKITAEAHRANQAVVRSSKKRRLRWVAAASTEPPPTRKQEASLSGNPMTAFQDDNKNIVSSKGFDFSSATANLGAYQVELLEMSQANMQFAFEYAQRLATIRSPIEILNVSAEFTSRRIAMLQKYSIEMVELDTKR
jgi:hypothetical protein